METVYNRRRINVISWLSYFFTGGLVSTLGIVIGPVATAFNKEPAFIGLMFSLMNIGLFLPIMISGILMRKFDLGKQLITGSIITILTCIALFVMPSITLFGVGVFLIGATAGLMMSIGSYLVVRINDDPKKRSANLIFTDFFFALSGMTLSLVLGFLFKHGASWLAMYGIMGTLSVLMILLCVGQKFPVVAKPEAVAKQDREAKEPWGFAAYVLCFALFAFVFSELVFTLWMPSWLHEHFGLDTDRAAIYITTYWMVKAIGLFLNQFTVRFVKLRTFLFVSAVIGLISLCVVTHSENAGLVMVAVGVFGFCNSGMFSGLMSYGSLQVKNSPPTLTSALLTTASVGTLIFASFSSFIYREYGLFWALNIATVSYVLLVLAVIIAGIRSKAEKIHREMSAG
ncbi:MFS transporter TsgA [Rahnella sp. AA]|uniref:MFS transporter TsgA n=1 Tax=Rahnella sp. AA TaxID=2057180 RepID=UPI000C33F1A9|nr:MFS transporter TsgA [Rahnella sp. AA]PKE31577.1 MFS transporter TsgA [Rahnella sp. AA]